MKRNLLFSAIIMFSLCGLVKAQEPVATMTVDYQELTTFKLTLKTKATTIITVDFGGGVSQDVSVGTTGTEITQDLLGAKTIEVYGEGIIDLDCSNNQLLTMDISKCADLDRLDCSNNLLVEKIQLGFEHGQDLKELLCTNNKFIFSTLNTPYRGWRNYEYYPQNPFEIVKQIELYAILDLTDEYRLNTGPGVSFTNFVWKKADGTPLKEGEFTMSEGFTAFNVIPDQPVYAELTNDPYQDPDTYEDYVFRSSLVEVVASTSVKEGAISGVKVYTHNQTLYVDVDQSAQLAVFNVSGRQVLSTPVPVGQNTYQLEEKGIFVIRLKAGDEMITRKVVIR